MALNFRPKSEEELAEEQLAPAGEYDFTVIHAEDATSRNGNSMIKVKLGIYRGHAIGNHVYDYLLEKMEYKLRHFCATTGLMGKYEAGTLCAEDCKGRSGRVKLAIDYNDDYPPKNVAKDYVVGKASSAPSAPAATAKAKPAATPAPDTDDDVPF